MLEATYVQNVLQQCQVVSYVLIQANASNVKVDTIWTVLVRYAVYVQLNFQAVYTVKLMGVHANFVTQGTTYLQQQINVSCVHPFKQVVIYVTKLHQVN